jgi:hypothetical protein
MFLDVVRTVLPLIACIATWDGRCPWGILF